MILAKPQSTQQPDPDADLSDHEWRLKMAAEGKAIYVPGRSVEEVKAEFAAGRKKQGIKPKLTKTNSFEDLAMINLSITEEQYDEFQQATDEAAYLLAHAGNVFDLLYSVYGTGLKLDDPGFGSMFALCGRAFANAAGKEGERLSQLDRILRAAKSEQLNKCLQPTA